MEIAFVFIFAVIGALIFLGPGLVMCVLSFGVSLPAALSKRLGPKLILLAPSAVFALLGMVAVGIGLLSAGLAIFCGLMIGLQMSGSPHETEGEAAYSEFQAAFGFAPPADVRNLHAMSYVFFDSGIRQLRFEAAPATVDRILGRGLSPSPCAEFDALAKKWPHGAPPPPWWEPPRGDERACYEWAPGQSRDWGCHPYLCRAKASTVYFVCPGSH